MDDNRIKGTLRARLKAGTRAMHDRLDSSVSLDDLATAAGYARFLVRQLAAREPIEDWADLACPALLRPPATGELLRRDLADLAPVRHTHVHDRSAACEAPGSPPSPALAPPAFTLPAGSDPLGAAWAIAGSHMGNRALLARLRRAHAHGGGAMPPSRFLGDMRMTGFWRDLLPRLEQVCTPAQAEPAIAAARAVFARFEQAFTADAGACKKAA